MRIFKTKWFSRWARKNMLDDQALCIVVAKIKQGLIDADLGSHVVKQRIALTGRGKRGGARTIIAFHLNHHTFFMYGFAKNERDTIDNDELEAFRILAKELLHYAEEQLAQAIEAGELSEVKDHA